MTVEEMLDRMSMSEFMRWVAFYGSKSGRPAKQTPEQIRANLNFALAGRKKKKHVA